MTDLLAAGSVLGPARRRVLADEVADAIREAIFAGRIDLGQRLVEEELATNLNVSRAPSAKRWSGSRKKGSCTSSVTVG